MWQPKSVPLYNAVSGALLSMGVLPNQAMAFERVSAAIAVRAALLDRKNPRALHFLVPEGTQTTARVIAAGLLAGSYAHEHGHGHLPSEEVRKLLTSSLLFVTPAVSECMNELEALKLGGTTTLPEMWDIVPLARQTAKGTAKGRVFIANPGWASSRMLARHYSAVIIDATHPRTLKQLLKLTELARQVAPLCVTVAPVLPPDALAELKRIGPADIFLWDPRAQRSAFSAIGGARRPPSQRGQHTLWICDEDPEVDALLLQAHMQLVSVSRASGGRSYAGIGLAWSIVNRLRSLTVPLALYEQAAAKTWAGGLSVRMRMLGEVSGHGDAVWDSSWPSLRAAVEAVYAAFLRRSETAKFWAIAVRLEQLLKHKGRSYRVVAPSLVEADLLRSSLQQIVDGLSQAVTSGRVEFVTTQEEAHRVADGSVAHTVLIGPRPYRARYLSSYPSRPIEQLVYPFEASMERAVLDRQYVASENLQRTDRSTLLERLGLSMISDVTALPTDTPHIEAKRADGRDVNQAVMSFTDSAFDIEALAAGDAQERDYFSPAREVASSSGELLEVEFKGGETDRFGSNELVDVFYSETDQIQRSLVSDLTPGMCVIRFVDGRYDTLFRRTAEAIERKLSMHDRIALELWDRAKFRLVESHGDKRSLYATLQGKGLKSTFSTFSTWFRDDNDTLAPQQIEEFMVVASATEQFAGDDLCRSTFRCIQKVRGRNRTVGRKLRALLRALLSESGYEEALESIRRVDPDMANAFAAIDVREVVRVHKP